jgi:hypothetical protein
MGEFFTGDLARGLKEGAHTVQHADGGLDVPIDGRGELFGPPPEPGLDLVVLGVSRHEGERDGETNPERNHQSDRERRKTRSLAPHQEHEAIL